LAREHAGPNQEVDSPIGGLRELSYIVGRKRRPVIAKTLGLTIPPSLLLPADQVID